jgi:DNA gyrase/topoisomerase IV subunit A
MFATRAATCRRNSLADFESINRNGKIAMKLEEGDRIVRVAICKPDDNVPPHRRRRGVASASPSTTCAVFQGRRLHGGARHQAGGWATR